MTIRQPQCVASMKYAVLVLAAALNGCATERIPAERIPGQTARAAFALQVAHPDAALKASAPQEGLSGAAAKASIDRYFRSFELPAPTSNLFTIGVGTGAGGSTASPSASGAATKR